MRASLILVLAAACGDPVRGAGFGAPLDALDAPSEAAPAADPEGADGVLWVSTATGPAPVRWADVGGYAVSEGDIILGRSAELASLRAHVTDDPTRTWPGGVVAFDVDPALPDPQRVRDAIQVWEAVAPVTFVRRTTETDYVRFVDGPACLSVIGRDGGPQDLTLPASCTTGTAVHEIGHALGLFHEHTRPDRDAHVQVEWGCIAAGAAFNFDLRTTGTKPHGPYDDQSIMHYASPAFLDPSGFDTAGQPCTGTLFRTDGSWIRAQRDLPSAGDVDAIEDLYGVGDTPLQVEVVSAPRPGEDFSARVFGADPGERVFLAGSLRGLGAGPCPGALGGACLSLDGTVKVLGDRVADGEGAASFVLRPPAGLDLSRLALQAAAKRGPGGADSVLSEPARWIPQADRGCGSPDAVRDCAGFCYPTSWQGDGFCDDGDLESWGSPDFDCPAFGHDAGDC